MKKLFVILLAALIVVSAVGCSDKAAVAPAKGVDTQAAADKALWPTKEWPVSTPEAQGMKTDFLSAADKRIMENYPNLYSLLVVRYGYLVYEKYYQGMGKYDSNPVYSVTKSVMSALIGIAINEKLIENTGQKVAGFLPEYFSQIDDERKKDITIENVLTMTGGLEPIDSDYAAYFTSGDWLDYALRKPLEDSPGKSWAYNTGLTHILSAVITKTSKMNTLEYAEKSLFEPLGIEDIQQWDKDAKGYYCGGSGLSLSPRDMAKLGYLYLKNGVWDGKQVIPGDWVAESTKKHLSVGSDENYGYLFWSWDSKAKINGKAYYAYGANGSGGQYIIVVPDLDVVAVVTANRNYSSKDKADTADIIWDYVIPSIK